MHAKTQSLSTPIFETVTPQLLDELLSVSDRYYTHKYCATLEDDKEVRQRCSFHSNRLCMISLADNHPVMNQNIKKVDFEISDTLSRLSNVVKGKGKKGAQKLEAKSVICYVYTEDDVKHPVYSTVKGKLLEINEGLIDNPELLQTHPTSNGYIALLLPDLKFYEATKEGMLSLQDYLKVCGDE